MSDVAPAAGPSFFQRWLNRVEWAGNLLPHPATLFILLCGVMVITSWLLSVAGITVEHPVTHKAVGAVNLLSVDGLHRIILGLLPNFVNFAPLGPVLVCLLGLALAEHAGLLGACLRLIVHTTPRWLLTWVVVWCGAMSHTAGDIGYVLLLPLSMALFHSIGRHPLAGLAAAFSGVSGGFAANLLISTSDVVLAGFTQEAARIIDPKYTVSAMANYYFLGTSVFLITVIGALVTERLVEPRFGPYRGGMEPQALQPLAPAERRGLRWALAVFLVLAGLVLAGLLPAGGVLQDTAKPGFINSYFVRGLVFFIFVFGLLPALAYGIVAGTVLSENDVYKGMQKTMELAAPYLVVVFFIAQFVNLFAWSNVGVILAVQGAALLKSLQLGPVPLLIGLVLLTASTDLFLGSASAKWAILAPVFVPMFMLLGYSPELTQAAYRVGDSVMNVVTPLASNFPLVLMFAQRYEPKAGVGTMVALMLPYSLCFMVGWTLLLILWTCAGWPLGPGAQLFLKS
ncbi:AbgT family transporter [Horticoccus sp. 23ND18S-11]|uniref:AbgT family transporter n=1 Tax=Horticoccus sp. 23ND18S-11 TaxID=3391832 RepID=UPI0039C92EB2